jgi:hypothetical protein
MFRPWRRFEEAMKHLALLAALFLAACSSTPQGPQANVAAPEFEIEQTFGPGDVGYPDGPLDVKYELRIRNRSTVPMTFKRLSLRTVNPAGGPYTLTQPLEHTFNVPIPPNGEKTVELWAHARSYGVSMRDREPVTLKGVAYFDTPQGYINQPIIQELQQ